MTPCDSYNRVLTSAFTAESPACSENIRASWNAIANITKDGMPYIYLSDLRFVSNDVKGSHIYMGVRECGTRIALCERN